MRRYGILGMGKCSGSRGPILLSAKVRRIVRVFPGTRGKPNGEQHCNQSGNRLHGLTFTSTAGVTGPNRISKKMREGT